MIRLVAIVLLCFAVPFGAAAEEPDFPQYNFLFIIDCSISMASRKPAVITLVRDLVGSGFNHRIAEGDSIDIWTYDTELHVNGFPPQIWDSHWGDRIANSAADYVEHAHLRGRSRSLSVRDDLGSLVLNTKGLMVLLITDGEESISGVGFDDAINDQLPKLRRKLTLQTQPFLISLSAINGRFSDWRIFGGLGRPPLAKLPNRQKPSAKE